MIFFFGVSVALAAPRIEVLESGLTVVVEARPSGGEVALDLRFPVGSEREGEGELGLAHLVEHRLLGGSRHVPPGVDWLDVAGVRWNAATTRDETSLWMTMHPSALERALFLVSDHLGWLGEGELERALEIDQRGVLQELEQRAADPVAPHLQAMVGLALAEGHPQRHSAAGLPAQIAAATPEQIRAFWVHHYAPEAAVLTLVGAIEEEQALEAVRRWFSDVPARPASAPPPLPAPRESGARATAPGSLPLTVYGWEVPGVTDPDAAALELLAPLLVGAFPEAVQPRPQAIYQGRARAGALLVAALGGSLEAAGGDPAARAVEALGAGVAPEALEEARAAALDRRAQQEASAAGRARSLGRCQLLFGRLDCAGQERARLEAVTAAEIAAVAGRWLSPGLRSELVVGPGVDSTLHAPSSSLPPAPPAPPPAPALEGGPDRSGPPPLGPAEPSPLPAPDRAQVGRVALAHLRVPGAREVLVEVALAQGRAALGADAAAAAAWAALVSRGPGLSASLDAERAVVRLQTSPEEAPAALARLATALRRPDLSRGALEEALPGLLSRVAGPAVALYRSWFGPESPYLFTPEPGQWAALRARHLRRLHRDLRRSRASILSAGDLPLEALREGLTAVARAAGGRREAPVVAAELSGGRAGLGFDRGGDRARATLALEMPPRGHPDEWLSEVVAHALEGACQGRLGNELGLIYGLDVQVERGLGFGLLVLTTETDTDHAPAALAEIEALVRRIARHGLPPELIDSARRELVRGWEASLSGAPAALLRYGAVHDGVDIEARRAGLLALSGATRADSQRVAARYLGEDAPLRWIIEGDRRALEGALSAPIQWR